MPPDSNDGGRRVTDYLRRWMEVILLGAVTSLLGVIVYFYGGMPQKINDLVTITGNMQLELSYLKDELRDLKDAARVEQDWRNRQVILEQKVQHSTERLTQVERRIEKLEEPPGIFGGRQRK